MLESRHLWYLATRIPRAFPGPSLHLWALEAMHAGESAVADQLFEAAASRYRVELAVEPLARLRAHQMIARVIALDHPEREMERILEIERAISRLDCIESLEPPFDLVDARSLLAAWLPSAAPAASNRDSARAA